MAKPTAFAYRTLGWLLLTALALVLLKAAGQLSWSWWLVLLPLWGPWAMLLAVAAGFTLWRFLVARR